jgi:type II secretory pathway component PulC
MLMVRSLFVALLIVIGSGCAVSSSREPKFIEDVRPVPPPMKVMSFSIQRRDLQEALGQAKENQVRIVPMYQSTRTSYEYRIFDIAPGSVYSLLGLEPSDVIVAADRYLVKRPEQFPAFVQLMPGLNQASIEIRRGGEARLLKYSFIPALAEKN